jgi:heterodisulfide reductase subunit B
MKYSYFPGCSLEKFSAAYNLSALATAKPLGIELVEVDDWNCCGATEYVSLNLIASYALIARNLALATKNDGLDQLVAPCSACYLNLSKCDKYMGELPDLAQKVNTALAAGGLSYQPGTIKVRHLLDVLVTDVGYDAIEAKVARPLRGLRVAPYYGCMILRPELGTAFDGTEHPTTMDRLLTVLGADVIDYPMKGNCCGGHMTQISEATGFDMIRRLVKGATDGGADLIVTTCPMCQMNLDGFQGAMNRHFGVSYHQPVLYFTQMIGLALGMDPKVLGIGSEIVSARQALGKIGVEVPQPEAAAAPKRSRKDDKSLPMPRAN